MLKKKNFSTVLIKRNNNRAATVRDIWCTVYNGILIYFSANRDHFFEGIINSHGHNSCETQTKTTVFVIACVSN